jgi:hypothetical protein
MASSPTISLDTDRSKVGLLIVQAVSIFVVDLNFGRGDSKNNPMHQHNLILSARLCIGRPLPASHAPIELAEASEILVINQRR